jgi:iron complex transport system permease protein
MGAFLVLAADFATQRMGGALPVGVATGALGGVYLAWLLWRKP